MIPLVGIESTHRFKKPSSVSLGRYHRMKTSSFILTAIFLSCFLTDINASDQPREHKKTVIAVQPYKGFSKELTKLVAKGLEDDYGMTVVILPVVVIPKEAYYKPRSRYGFELFF